MKKFIFMLIAMFTFAIGSINAQAQNDYAGSSKFTDNVSVTLQGGVLTSFDNFYFFTFYFQTILILYHIIYEL